MRKKLSHKKNFSSVLFCLAYVFLRIREIATLLLVNNEFLYECAKPIAINNHNYNIFLYMRIRSR
jgi:hypothetical protein